MAMRFYPALQRGSALPLQSATGCLGEGLSMPKGPKGEKRPADVVGALALLRGTGMGLWLAGEVEEGGRPTAAPR